MAGISVAVPVPRVSRIRVTRTLRGLRRNSLFIISVFILAIVVLAGILASWISPHDPRNGELSDKNIPPVWYGQEFVSKTVVDQVELGKRKEQISLREARKLKEDVVLGEQVSAPVAKGGSWNQVLGTDHLGRDIFSRIIHGARISLIVAAVTLGVGGVIGTVLGLVSGWYGGWIDELIMRVVDIFLSLPLILVALVLVVSLGQSFAILVTVLVLFMWVRFARLVRGEVLRLKTMDYVALARVAGASTPRILFVHLLPGVTNTVIVIATLQVGVVILLESSLSFLGAGVPPPTPAWGSMVADGRDRLAEAWWISTMPGLAILLTVMALNLFGDWLRDTLDPRLRQME